MKPVAPKALLPKVLRTVSRLILLSLAAALFTLLTSIYARSVRTPTPTPRWSLHRTLAPRITQIPEFFGEALLIAACTMAGRFVFRLRLSSHPPRQGQRIHPSQHRKPQDR